MCNHLNRSVPKVIGKKSLIRAKPIKLLVAIETREDLGGRRNATPPPPPPSKMTCGFLIQLASAVLKFVYITSQLRHSLVVHPS